MSHLQNLEDSSRIQMILFRLELKHQQFDQTKTFNSEKAMLKKDVVYGRKCGRLFVTSGKTVNTNTAQTLWMHETKSMQMLL